MNPREDTYSYYSYSLAGQAFSQKFLSAGRNINHPFNESRL